MTDSEKNMNTSTVLSDEIAGEMGAALKPLTLSDEKKARIKSQVMERIKKNPTSTEPDYLTIKNTEGRWLEIAPGVSRKNLHVDPSTTKTSFLLRIQPGCKVPGHKHHEDELCVVLEGDVSLGEIHLNEGDFHLARKGSNHGLVRSEGGAVLFIQAAA
ncbi:MAG: cupin domain-containing protein [Gammaproteobacteria bacterium]|nr:cupin domain-containing protein [Gammaproteobacteria bacterium]